MARERPPEAHTEPREDHPDIGKQKGRKGRSRRPKVEVPRWRQDAYARFSAASHLPMVILAILYIPVLIVPIVDRHLSHGVTSALDTADYLIWGLFALEYGTRLFLAPDRRNFFHHHIVDLVVVAVPILRPLRVIRSVRALRSLRLLRMGAVAEEGVQEAKRGMHFRALNYAVVITIAMVLIISVVVLDLERDVAGSNIKTFADALWWAIVTITTVGYGDRYPVSHPARALAAVLMVGGVALFGVLTASIAAFFVDENQKEGDSSFQEVLRRLYAIEVALGSLTSLLPAMLRDSEEDGAEEPS